MSRQRVINISPYEYIHVKDNNSSIISVITGPTSYIIQEHQELIFLKPKAMIVIPPMHYARIRNPVLKDEKGKVIIDKNGQVKLADSEIEIRLNDNYKTPFYLYYGEELVGEVERLKFIKPNCAIHLRCVRAFEEDKLSRKVGDEWMLYGPKLFIPRQEVEVVSNLEAIILKPYHSLRIKAIVNFVDRNGVERKADEEWLIRKEGGYIPDVYEKVICQVQPLIITEKNAYHIRAIRSFTDIYGKVHRAGDEWLITLSQSSWHILDIYEELIKEVSLTILTNDNYVVILNPIDSTGKNLKGGKKLVQGGVTFFLQPGEELENGIQKAKILDENQSILLQAKEKFVDSLGELRVPGDKWLIRGPSRFVPPIEVDQLAERSLILLNEKEGIYVRDNKSGTIRSIIGKSYMLEANEDLWEKELSDIEERILQEKMGNKKRDKTRVVSYECPYNTIMQIYNFKTEKTRLILGPDFVMLEPDEQFSLMSLSGKTPKQPGVIKTLYLSMGPTYTTDKIEVETSDHALLIIEVAYNWFFDVKSKEDYSKIFTVRDCIGEMCSIMASRVRGSVAEMSLNEFHKSSARTIRKAVMGVSEEGKIKDKFLFENNLLAISNVDIKAITTKDEQTQMKLQVTVNKAIELTTKSQEEEAKAQAEYREQEAKSILQRKINEDNRIIEEMKKPLYVLKSKTQTITETGEKESEEKANAIKKQIEFSSKLCLAKNNKEVSILRNELNKELEHLEHEINMSYNKNKSEIELDAKVKISNFQTSKFNKIIEAIGKETLVQISNAGRENQIRLLNALGLEGFIMTDGNDPINLFDFGRRIVE